MIRAPMKALWITIACGLVVGALCAASLEVPAIRALEQRFGLQWLFDLRGPVEPPQHAILILHERALCRLDLAAARSRALPSLRGPARGRAARDTREPAGAAFALAALRATRACSSGSPRPVRHVVVFDVLFRERPPLPGAVGDLHAWQDATLARAASMTRVFIGQKVEESGGSEQLAALSPAISDAVLGSAPFPLVAEPNRRFDRFMAFKEEGLVTPTLPAIALQAYAVDGYPFLRDFLVRHAGENATLLPQSTAEFLSRGQLQATALLIRELAHHDAKVAAELRRLALDTQAAVKEPATAQAIGALGALYAGDGTRLLNLYGPAGTLPSVGYDEVLTAPVSDNVRRFGGKVVFVGYGETRHPEQVEHFSTVYTRSNGADLSGVEIAATAFSNLLDDRTLRELPLRDWLVLTFLAGFLAFVVCHGFGNRIAIVLVVVLAGAIWRQPGGYLIRRAWWMPVVLPLAVALPFGSLIAFGLKFLTAHQQRAAAARRIQSFRAEGSGRKARAKRGRAGRFAGVDRMRLRCDRCGEFHAVPPRTCQRRSSRDS
jgi:adenylate cyclase